MRSDGASRRASEQEVAKAEALSLNHGCRSLAGEERKGLPKVGVDGERRRSDLWERACSFWVEEGEGDTSSDRLRSDLFCPPSPQGLSFCRKVKRLHLYSGSRISVSGQRVCDQPSLSLSSARAERVGVCGPAAGRERESAETVNLNSDRPYPARQYESTQGAPSTASPRERII